MSEQTLEQFAATILEDGVIDDDETQQIRDRIYADGVIDRDEANFLFTVNERATQTCDSFNALFVEALTSHVLDDDTSPNEVDDDEAAWLRGQIENDGTVDDNEKALLTALRDRATGTVPADLQALFTSLG